MNKERKDTSKRAVFARCFDEYRITKTFPLRQAG